MKTSIPVANVGPLSVTRGGDATYYASVTFTQEQAPDGYYWRLRNGRYHLVRRPKRKGDGER